MLYDLYRAGLLAFYLGFCALGVWALHGAEGGPAGGEVMGLGIAAVGALCALLVVASFWLPRAPWAWNAHLVLVVLGVVGVVTTPCALLVALLWFRRDTLAWFGQRLERDVPHGEGPPPQDEEGGAGTPRA